MPGGTQGKKSFLNISHLQFPLKEEVIEKLGESKGGWVERIVSEGHTTAEGQWYDQITDEWVLLMQGKAILEFMNDESIELHEGDYYFIPAGMKHRVSYTSSEPKCIWLAIHFNKQNTEIK
ncbi:MAG: cupin domain-containing protein [Bacteroidales bacterium]|nr:cupin domain-containing protein [Bacteroidales bacterium]